MVLVQANGQVGQQGAVADYHRGRPALRASRRGLPWRPAAARDRRTARARGCRARPRARARRRTLRLRRHRRRLERVHPREVLQMAGIRADFRRASRHGPAHVDDPESGSRGVHRRDVRRRRWRWPDATSAPVATLDGDVVSGPHLVSGGAKVESRGILATKREIRELRERIATDRAELARLAEETARTRHGDRAGDERARRAERTSSTVRRWRSSHSRRRPAHAREEAERLSRKADVIALERRQAEEERASIEARVRRSRSVNRAAVRGSAACRRGPFRGAGPADYGVAKRSTRSARARPKHAPLTQR